MTIGNADVAAIRAFLDPPHAELAAAIGEFARAEIAPEPPPGDDAAGREQARRLLAKLGAGGWCRHAVPSSFGGVAEAIDLRACCLIRETLAAASPLADSVFALQCLGSLPLALAGSEELKRDWLPRVAAGEAMAAFAMTEPEAGSDAAAMATRARREGDEYVLEGHKTLITNAGLADFYTLFAVTDPQAGRGRRVSCFVIPAATPGLHFAAAQVLSAPHPLGELHLEGCRVPAAALLGAEGEGLKLGLATLDRLRATVAAAACGMASRALAEALARARRRKQFGRSLADFQITRQKLARMATDLAAARLLTYRAAWEADRGGGRLAAQSSMAKAFATEAAQRVVDDAVQICGGQGVLADHPVDLLYRAVRALRIYEGTTEIQRLVIARELLSGAEGARPEGEEKEC